MADKKKVNAAPKEVKKPAGSGTRKAAEKAEPSGNKPQVSPIFIGIVIGLLFAAGWGFWNQFQDLEEVGRYKACLEVERDPALTVPCTCRPKELNNTESELDEVYEKTDAVCICNCILDDGTEESFEIRRATGKEATDDGRLSVPNI